MPPRSHLAGAADLQALIAAREEALPLRAISTHHEQDFQRESVAGLPVRGHEVTRLETGFAHQRVIDVENGVLEHADQELLFRGGEVGCLGMLDGDVGLLLRHLPPASPVKKAAEKRLAAPAWQGGGPPIQNNKHVPSLSALRYG